MTLIKGISWSPGDDSHNSNDSSDDGTASRQSLAAVKRVNVQLPDEIHTRAKVLAVLRGTTLNEFLERAIVQAVEKEAPVLDRLGRK